MKKANDNKVDINSPDLVRILADTFAIEEGEHLCKKAIPVFETYKSIVININQQNKKL